MTVDLSTVETITRLAEQFGPFLFAILFILVVTRTARSYYRDCTTRKDPPPSEQETKTYRQYFLCSVWAGIVVMAMSIGWWFYAHSKGSHYYQVTIRDLTAEDQVLSDFYSKLVPRPIMAGVMATHDMLFLIVRDQPFKVGERFSFNYYKVESGPVRLSIAVVGKRVEFKYNGNLSETYRLVSDAAGLHLEAVADNNIAAASVFTADDIRRANSTYAIASATAGRRTEP